MKAKLQHLIKSEGLTASRFAEMLEIQPAGVSHILAGRNKPSFDLLQKILRRFPKINPDWLLLDSEQMYRDGWSDAGNLTNGTTASNSFDGAGNQTMPMNSLFGGAAGNSNASDGANVPRGTNGGVGISGGANIPSGANGGTNGGHPFGVQNLSRGEAHISAAQGVGTASSHSHAGSPIQKIVIFYADGTFEAYFHGF